MNTETILIVGASSDLGVSLISRLLHRPLPVRILAHHNATIDPIARLAREHPQSVCPMKANLADFAETERLVRTIETEYGCPDQIVHMAGLPLHLERFPDADLDRFREDFEIQVGSIMRVLRAFLPEMSRKARRTRVLFVLSNVTLGSAPKFMPMYTLVKYAQLGLVRALASEYCGTSVTINAVSPSMIRTRFISEVPPKAVELVDAKTPGGLLAPADVTGVLEFLMSEGSERLHGTNLPITAGSTI